MQWFTENAGLIFATLFAFSEALSLWPTVKSNGVFQAVQALLKLLKDSAKFPQPTDTKTDETNEPK